MPMTRSAASAVRPLESRSLAPYVAEVPSPKAAHGHRDDSLGWGPCVSPARRGAGLQEACRRLAVAGDVRELVSTDKTIRVTFGGVPFVAFGVPGVEVSPLLPGTTPWQRLYFAVRYDIPALDEAFASTALPPADLAVPSDEREGVAERPVATALDWPLMGQLWHEQDRCRQNASWSIPISLCRQHQPMEITTAGVDQPGARRHLEAVRVLRTCGRREPLWSPRHPNARCDDDGDTALLGLSLDKKSITLRFEGKDLTLTRMVGWSPAGFDGMVSRSTIRATVSRPPIGRQLYLPAPRA